MADTLLLNADAQPVTYLPLSVVTWQEAVKFMVLEKARVVEYYEDWVVHSEHWETRVPAVLMLTEFMKPKTGVRFSKANVFLRDQYICQYCGLDLKPSECTLDHVLPISKGGKSVWLNSTTACGPCNSRKGNSKLKPKNLPHKPDYWELAAKRKKMHYQIKHDSWDYYIK
jgi:5-methylcytosine-specific restriction endonuclease McrA